MRADKYQAARTALVAEGYHPRFAPPGEPTPWCKPPRVNYQDAVVLVTIGNEVRRVPYYDYYAGRMPLETTASVEDLL